MENPLKNIEFPALTLCPSPDFQPDDWALTEQIFNSFDSNCNVGNDDCKQIRILNRILTWNGNGIIYEPDQRHVEILIKELFPNGCNAVVTPGVDSKHTDDSDLDLLNDRDTTLFR